MSKPKLASGSKTNPRKRVVKRRRLRHPLRKVTPRATYPLHVPRGFSAAIRNARSNIGSLLVFLVDQLPNLPTGEKIGGMLDLLSWLAEDVVMIRSVLDAMLVEASGSSKRSRSG